MDALTETIVCVQCAQPLSPASKFCKSCGAFQLPATSEGNNRDIITALIIFYALEFGICALVKFNDAFNGLKPLLIVDLIMALYAIGFTWYIRKDVKEIFRWESFSFKKLGMYMGITIVLSIVVQYTSNWLNYSLFDTEEYYYYGFIGFRHPALLMLLVVAVNPAIFEELAYRGFLTGGLLKILDKKSAVFISSFLFALIHLNLLSFVWLLPFALLLGHVRIKENTLWYGVVMHFSFNAVACLVELYQLHLF